jgi:hypothetical protein
MDWPSRTARSTAPRKPQKVFDTTNTPPSAAAKLPMTEKTVVPAKHIHGFRCEEDAPMKAGPAFAPQPRNARANAATYTACPHRRPSSPWCPKPRDACAINEGLRASCWQGSDMGEATSEPMWEGETTANRSSGCPLGEGSFNAS